jgi:iron complex transport system ATP-binding protein
MIKLDNFAIGYDGRHLMSGVTTAFLPGTLTALIGRNGIGKSTLLRAIAGLNRAYSGDVVLSGVNQRKLVASEIAKTLAFVTTERTRIANLRCMDVVAIGRAPYTNWIGRMQDEDKEVVMQALNDVGMSDYAGRTMDKMSDGECQRIMIARALAQETPIVLLDEPTSFLDLPNRYELVMLLQRLSHEQGKCIIFSTHELDIATRMCDNIALVADGNMYNMNAAEMLRSGHIERMFGTNNIRFEVLNGMLNIMPSSDK